MSDKPKFPRDRALVVAKELCDALKPVTERLIVAGSLRRRKLMVADVEILFIPKLRTIKEELFDSKEVPATDEVLEAMLSRGIIAKRKNGKDSEMWGAKNKLAVHVSSSIPVDLFAATEANWWNYLVCRTGNAQNNIAICQAAIGRKMKWNPYGAGFTDDAGQIRTVTSERDVYELVGLPYREPWERDLK